MNLVNDLLGTQLNSGVQLAIIFGVLLVVLLLVVWLIRMVFGNNVSRIAKNRQPRLSVTDAAIVDDKRRLVLVRRDDVEHLILIGGNSDVLVEGNISRVTAVQVPASEQALENVKSSNKKTNERPAKLSPKRFGSVIGGKDKSDKVSSAGVTALGAVAAVGASVAATASKSGSSATALTEGASSSVADFGKKAAETTKTIGAAVKSVKDDATQAVSKNADAIKTSGNSAGKTKTTVDVANTDAPIVKADSKTTTAPKEEVIQEEVKPVEDKSSDVDISDVDTSDVDNSNSAEYELEQALGADVADVSGPSDPADEDMQKILDELTAEIK